MKIKATMVALALGVAACAEDVTLERSGFVRSLGAKALLTDMNNGPHPPEKMAVREKWLDYFDNHFYIDHPKWLGTRLHLPFRISNIDIFDYSGGPADSCKGVGALATPGMSNADRAAARCR